MQGAIVPAPPRVPIVFDRALTDVLPISSDRGETKRRLAEASSIIEALEHPTKERIRPRGSPGSMKRWGISLSSRRNITLLDRTRESR